MKKAITLFFTLLNIAMAAIGWFASIQMLKAYYSDCGYIEVNGNTVKQQSEGCTVEKGGE